MEKNGVDLPEKLMRSLVEQACRALLGSSPDRIERGKASRGTRFFCLRGDQIVLDCLVFNNVVYCLNTDDDMEEFHRAGTTRIFRGKYNHSLTISG